mmetsp:Transcript_42822/g.99454  ORF Transcript_42822/g.99454 Transcript_42822/m.99454 type:complete len:215 (+) Transcript_42822:1511-2155(+)
MTALSVFLGLCSGPVLRGPLSSVAVVSAFPSPKSTSLKYAIRQTSKQSLLGGSMAARRCCICSTRSLAASMTDLRVCACTTGIGCRILRSRSTTGVPDLALLTAWSSALDKTGVFIGLLNECPVLKETDGIPSARCDVIAVMRRPHEDLMLIRFFFSSMESTMMNFSHLSSKSKRVDSCMFCACHISTIRLSRILQCMLFRRMIFHSADSSSSV